MKTGLGKGLDALFVDNEAEEKEKSSPFIIRISEIEPNREQPRKRFDDERLSELADSIKKYGVLSPILVKPISNNRYKIIAGERRWRASRLAGLAEIPAIVREFDNLETIEAALIENLQREDLNVIEEAQGYKLLIDEYNLTQEQISEKVSKSRPTVANALRILNLPETVLEKIRDNKISAGHARALLAFDDIDFIIKTAERIEKENLSVRDVEKMSSAKKQAPKTYPKDDQNILKAALIRRIEENLGRKAHIISGKNKGKIELEYYSDDDLDKLVQFLSGDEKL